MSVTLLAAVVGVVTGVLQASFFEWAYHRYWLHRPWMPPQMFTAHTLVHHQLCKHDDTFHVTEEEQEEALSFQWWGGFGLTALNVLPWTIAAFVFARVGMHLPSLPFVLALSGTFFTYYLCYEGFHLLMHKPMIPWLENMGWFKFLKKHHRLHHVYMGSNFNVIFPLADAVLGTYVGADPQAPKITGPEAKRVARRHSRFGRKLREIGQEEFGLPQKVARAKVEVAAETDRAEAQAIAEAAGEPVGAASDRH